MFRLKAYIVVLLLCAGPLGIYLAARERAPFPPPPIAPPPEKLDILPARALDPAPPLSPGVTTAEPPLAEPLPAPKATPKAAPKKSEPPRFERAPGKPEPKAPPKTVDVPPRKEDSQWKPVRPKSDEPVLEPNPEALPVSPAPVEPKQIEVPGPVEPEKKIPPALTPGTITDPEPIVLPESAVVNGPVGAKPPAVQGAKPQADGVFVFPEPTPPLDDIPPPAPLPQPELPSEPPRFSPAVKPEPQRVLPFEQAPFEPVKEVPPPQPLPLPQTQIQPEPEPEPTPLTPTPQKIVEQLPEPQPSPPLPRTPIEPPPQLQPLPEPVPVPPRPLLIEPEERPMPERDDELPAFRIKSRTAPAPAAKAPFRQPNIDNRIPPMPVPELSRKQPPPPEPPASEAWKRDTSPRPLQGSDEETPAFRLVRPRPLGNDVVNQVAPAPSLNAVNRAAPANGMPALSVEKIGPQVARLGETIVFELVVRNAGYQVADNLNVVDELPYGIRFVSAEPMPTRQGEKLTWAVSRLHPGQPHRIRLSVQASAAGTYTSRSLVQSYVSTQTQIRIDPADYVVSINAPRQVPAGQIARIEIVVNNATGVPRAGLVLKANLPEGLSHTLGPRVEADVELQPGENRKFSLPARALQPGIYTVEAWLEDGDSRFAKTQVEITVSEPTSSVDSPRAEESRSPGPDPKTAGRLTVRAIGTRMARDRDGELRVDIVNLTNAAIGNLAITAALPATVDFLDASDKGMYHRATKTIYWFVDNVAPGQTRSLVVRVRGKNAGRGEFRVQAGTEAGKRALTQAPVIVEELTTRLEPNQSPHSRLDSEMKSGYKHPPSGAENETRCDERIWNPAISAVERAGCRREAAERILGSLNGWSIRCVNLSIEHLPTQIVCSQEGSDGERNPHFLLT